jgi:uncharacterized protein YodC (DUF2158 family)
MTVVKDHKDGLGTVTCQWFVGDDTKEKSFRADALVRVKAQ